MANMNNKKLNLNGDTLPPLPLINPDGSWETEKKTIITETPKNNQIVEQKTVVQPEYANREDLERMYATMQMQQALKGIERTAEEEALKNQTISNIMSRLQTPIEMPRKKTISDILNGSNFGERLETFAQYAQQPEFQRNLGNAFGTRLFNKNTGRFENTGERLNREREAYLNAEQAKTLEQQKIQDLLGKDVFNSMNALDRENLVNERELQRMLQSDRHFNDSLKAQIDNSNRNFDIQNKKIDATLAGIEADREYRNAQAEYEKLQDLKNDAQQAFLNNLAMLKFDEDKRHNIATEENQANKKVKSKADEQEELANETLKKLSVLMDMHKKLPQNSASPGGKFITAKLTGFANSKGIQNDNMAAYAGAANLVTNLIMRKIAEEKGVATDQDFKRAQAMTPQISDTPGQAENKVKSIYALLGKEYNNSDTIQFNNALNDDYVNMKAPSGKIYKVPKEKVKEMEQKGGEII